MIRTVQDLRRALDAYPDDASARTALYEIIRLGKPKPKAVKLRIVDGGDGEPNTADDGA